MAAVSFDPRQPRVNCGPTKVISRYTEANSQTFKAGSLVKFSSGKVAVAATGDSPVMGIALKDATNVTSGNVIIPVQIFEPNTEILIQVSSAGTLEAADTSCVAGVAYDIILDSTTSFWTLDSTGGAGSNPQFVFIESVADVNGDDTYWAKVRPYYAENQATAQ